MAQRSTADELKQKCLNGLITGAQYKEMIALLESPTGSLGAIPLAAAADQERVSVKKGRTGLARFLSRK
jgi:hypothetical protein